MEPRIDSSELDLYIQSANSDKGAKTISSANDAVTTGQLHAKNKNQFRHRHYIFQKFNLKWVTVLVKLKSIKTLDDNTEETEVDFGYSGSLFRYNNKDIPMKRKN